MDAKWKEIILLKNIYANGNIDVIRAVVGHTGLKVLALNSCLQRIYIMYIQKILAVGKSTFSVVLAG